MMARNLTLLLLTVELAGAGVLLWRIRWKDYPALMTYLAFNVLAAACALRWYQYTVALCLLPRMVIHAWMLCEDYEQSRSKWPLRESLITAVCACVAALGLSVGTWLSENRPAIDNLASVHQYFTLALAGCAWALVVRAHWWPMLERKRNRAYRWGVAGILGIWAFASGFGRSGLAYGVFPQTAEVWAVVRIGVLIATNVTTAAMCLGMAQTETVKRAARISGVCRRSNVAYRAA